MSSSIAPSRTPRRPQSLLFNASKTSVTPVESSLWPRGGTADAADLKSAAGLDRHVGSTPTGACHSGRGRGREAIRGVGAELAGGAEQVQVRDLLVVLLAGLRELGVPQGVLGAELVQ